MGNKQSSNLRILMIGLDSAGKTSTLLSLKNLEKQQTIPTVGYNVETIIYKNTKLNIWDIGGQTNIRPLWRRHFLGTQAIIFVIDSADADRFEEAKTILYQSLESNELADIPLIILANKQDQVNASSIDQIVRFFGFDRNLGNRPWKIEGTCATNGEGLGKVAEWLYQQIKKKGSKT